MALASSTTRLAAMKDRMRVGAGSTGAMEVATSIELDSLLVGSDEGWAMEVAMSIVVRQLKRRIGRRCCYFESCNEGRFSKRELSPWR